MGGDGLKMCLRMLSDGLPSSGWGFICTLELRRRGQSPSVLTYLFCAAGNSVLIPWPGSQVGMVMWVKGIDGILPMVLI